MRKSSGAATAVLLLTAYAAGQGNLALPLRTQDKPTQDRGAVQMPMPKAGNPDAASPPSGNSDQVNPGQASPNGPAAGPPMPGELRPTVTVLDRLEVQGILGKQVRSGANEDMGRIIDVIVDRSGQVRAAIIDFGGFLGVGNRRIAVAWNALRFPPDPKDPTKVDRIGLDLSREQVQAAPEYREDKPVVVLGASGGLESLPFP